MRVKDLLETFDENELIIIKDHNVEYKGFVNDAHIRVKSDRIIKDS